MSRIKMAFPRDILAAIALVAVVAFASAAVAEDERGEKLFDFCSQCHQVDGSGNQLAQAPSIAGLETSYVQKQLENFRAGIRGAHPDDFAGLRMHPMALQLVKDEDLVAVAAYVGNLPIVKPAPSLEGGDEARGSELYKPCVACHAADGNGVKALSGPALNHSNDWYLLDQLKKFKSGVRGGDPRDLSGALMGPMTFALTDEQAMKDVIAYIMTLAP